MRKILLIVGGLVVVAAVGVSAVWYVGEPEARARFESALQRVTGAGGLETEFADVSMGGFPFAYEATFSDLTMRNLERGYEIALPELRGRVSPASPNSVRLTFPEQFTIVDQTGANPAGLKITSENLVADVADAGDARGAIDMSAERVTLEPVDPLTIPEIDSLNVTYVNPTVAGDFTQRTLANGGDLRFELTADALEMEMEGAQTGLEADGERSLSMGTGAIKTSLVVDQEKATAESVYSDLAFKSIDVTGGLLEIRSSAVEVSGSYAGATEEQMQAFRAAIVDLFNGTDPEAMSRVPVDADAKLGFDMRLADVDASVTGLAEGGGQTIRWTSGEILSNLDVGEAGAAFSNAFNQVGFELIGPVGRGGGFETMALSGLYPNRSSPDVQTVEIDYELKNVTMDDQTWAELNSSGALEREIEGLTVDVQLGVVVNQDLLNPQLATDAPVEFRTVDLTGLDLKMLGFTGAAAGAVTLEEAGPTGAVRVVLDNWRNMLTGLANSQLIGDMAPMAGMAQLTLETLVVPGETPEQSVMDVEFAGQQVIVNGRPLGQPQ